MRVDNPGRVIMDFIIYLISGFITSLLISVPVILFTDIRVDDGLFLGFAIWIGMNWIQLSLKAIIKNTNDKEEEK